MEKWGNLLMCISSLNSCFQSVFFRIKGLCWGQSCAAVCCIAAKRNGSSGKHLASEAAPKCFSLTKAPTDELEVAGEHPARGNHSPVQGAVLWLVHSPRWEWRDWDTEGPCSASIHLRADGFLLLCSFLSSKVAESRGWAQPWAAL